MLTVFCQGSTGTITTIEFEPGVINVLQIAPADIGLFEVYLLSMIMQWNS